jgi:hypothetical protein
MHSYQCYVFIFGMGNPIFSPMHHMPIGTLVSRCWQLEVFGRRFGRPHIILQDIVVLVRHIKALLFLLSLWSIPNGLPRCVRSLTAYLRSLSHMPCSLPIVLS